MGGKIIARDLRKVYTLDEGFGRRPQAPAGEFLLRWVALPSLEVYTVQR